MKTASFVKFLPSYLNGSLYQLSHEISYVDAYRQKQKTYWLSLSTQGGFTEAYAANLNGHFMCSSPLVKSRSGEKHEGCLERLGFKLIK